MSLYTTQVTVLMSVDLLRQQQRWRDSLTDIRQMMATLVQEVCYVYVHTHAINGTRLVTYSHKIANHSLQSLCITTLMQNVMESSKVYRK